METSKPIVSASQAIGNKQAILIDARGGADAYLRYLKGHLSGALFVDLESDLSLKSADAANGGRHPLPGLKVFADVLGKLGITPNAHLFVYDDKAGANAAARFWWMMKAIGHQHIHVIDGGLNASVKAGAVLSTNVPIPIAVKSYPVSNEWKLPTVDINTVSQVAGDSDYVVIDVRERYRYRGESEPIDVTAGHIPGAINIPYIENLNTDGSFHSAEELKEKYSPIVQSKPENVIVHCGSGVTACHTLLAMEQAGITGAKLYVGSWSEWSRREMPIAVE